MAAKLWECAEVIRWQFAACLCLIVVARQALAFTQPSDLAAITALHNALVNRSMNWQGALASWQCPTDPASSDGDCDICGKNWSGNWEHVHCRGEGAAYGEGSKGNYDGHITNVHITDMHLDGPVPQEFCDLKYIREFDLDGGNFAGPFPDWLTDPNCLPIMQELDLSYNRLTGTMPAAIANKLNITELKVEDNEMVGTIPNEIGEMPNLRVLRLATNHFHGKIPSSLGTRNATLNQLLLEKNMFSGDLESLYPLRLLLVSTNDNPDLCGMVPAGIRYAHGYNPLNTGLGLPCPDS